MNISFMKSNIPVKIPLHCDYVFVFEVNRHEGDGVIRLALVGRREEVRRRPGPHAGPVPVVGVLVVVPVALGLSVSMCMSKHGTIPAHTNT